MTEVTKNPAGEAVPPRLEMAWDAWGLPSRRAPLGEGILALLRTALGVNARPAPQRLATAVPVGGPRLSALQRTELVELLGPNGFDDSHTARLLHAGGKSTLDLLRRRLPGIQSVPDAVASPASESEVLALLRWAAGSGAAVVPFGGGTSVVGGVESEHAGRNVIAVDTHRFAQLLELDEVSQLATLGAGLTGPQVEGLLAARGFTLGHFPQSFQFATIGGFSAARSSGQASAGYGRFDEMVQSLRLVTPVGAVTLGRVAASAAGPDLRALALGSEGTLGVITWVQVRVHRAPEHTEYSAWRFGDFAAGAAAVRAVAQAGVRPTVMRLSDEAETGVNLAMTSQIGAEQVSGGALAIITCSGTEADARWRASRVAEIFTAAGGASLGADPARSWEHGRFDAPYLRDSLLDAGALCETLETATVWSRLAELKAAVTAALTDSLAAAGTPPLVMCHISHTYHTGASLYFTVVAAQAGDPIRQWVSAKSAAAEAISAAEATITHHHAVGRDHRPWLAAELGEVGMRMLAAVKREVDPAGVCNPGVLLP